MLLRFSSYVKRAINVVANSNHTSSTGDINLGMQFQLKRFMFWLKDRSKSYIFEDSLGSFAEFTSRDGLLRSASKVENVVENGLTLDTIKEPDLIFLLASSNDINDFVKGSLRAKKKE